MLALPALCVDPDASRHEKILYLFNAARKFFRDFRARPDHSPEGRDLIETLASLETAQRNFGHE